MPKYFERVELTPEEVTAGDSACFVFTLVVGPDFPDQSCRIILDLPATLGMSRPSLLHQEMDGFVEVYCTNPELTWTKRLWDMELTDFATKDKMSYRGMACRMFVLDVGPGAAVGDQLRICWGETGGGYGPGTKVTTVVPQPNYRARAHVRLFLDPDGGLPDFGRSFAGHDRPEPDEQVEVTFGLLPRKLDHLRLIRTHDRALLVPLDVYDNVATLEDPDDAVEADSSPEPNGQGAWRFSAPNVHVTSKGPELRQGPAMDDVFEGLNLYWGDIHSHSSWSVDCVEREKLQMTPGDLMTFARDRAGLDFYAVTDHHQPWDHPRQQIARHHWESTLADVEAHHRGGEFLVFPGIEYRCPRGDTAVVFSFRPGYEEICQPGWTDIRRLWEGLEGREYLSIAHFHNPGRLEPGQWWQNIAGGVEPVLEIFSCHGSYERADVLEQSRPQMKSFRPDRNGLHFLQQGLRYGFVCNSDGHKGHVGSNGVTAVFAESLEPAAIFEAYRKRHVYGTSNARIRLVFTGNGKLMGSAVADEPDNELGIDVTGEAALKKVDLFRNGQLHKRYAPQEMRFRTHVKVGSDPGSFWYVRATQQDNHVAWSSPIWLE